MPDQPPLDTQPDPRDFGVPVNTPPFVVAPRPVPEDPDRERIVSDNATHVVLANTLGGVNGWVRGDMIHEDDLPDGGHSFDTLMRLKPYPAVRPMDDDDRKAADDHRKARAEREKAIKDSFRPKAAPKAAEPPGPVKADEKVATLTDAPKDDPKKGK